MLNSREKYNMNINISNNKMHTNEFDITDSLVQQLIAEQFPHWATLSIRAMKSSGTSNAIYRLGEKLSIRLPRIPSAVDAVNTEFIWLTKFASQLPFPIAAPSALGKPTDYYPWLWSVCRWIEGENPIEGQFADSLLFASDLAKFITAFHKIDAANGPASYRGQPLIKQDEETRVAIKALHGKIDTEAALSAWEEMLQIPQWDRAPVWIHGDLMPGNLLIKNNRLSGVIDFGCMGVGDPASDLITAWNLLPSQARQVFKQALNVDDATWARGRGWAFSMALVQLPYYEHTNPVLAVNARYTINEILSLR